MAQHPDLKDVAHQIIYGSFKILFPSIGDRIDGFHEIARAIRGLKSDSRAARVLPMRLGEAADHIVDQLSQVEANEFGKISKAERELAIEGIVTALKDSEISLKSFVRGALDRDRLVSALEPAARQSWSQTDLSDSATGYGRLFLGEACKYIDAIVRDLPGFESSVIWETLILTRKIDFLLENAISNVVLPRFRPGTSTELATFESAYRSDIAAQFKYSDLFGVNLPPELRTQPIDITYIHLRSSTTSRPEQDWPHIDVALGKLIEGMQGSRRGVRALITGLAGSGKTTIAQWLAVQLALSRLPEPLILWQRCVPFVVSLRHEFAAGRPPNLDSLIRASSHHDDTIPGGWIRDTLQSKDSVIILDGLDELSEHDRVVAMAWIDKLAGEFIRANLIVTSRPENLDLGWFRRHRFERLELLPMNADEARECVSRWFEALLSSTLDRDRPVYRKRRDQLLHDLLYRQTVRDLAETPLLCAMLCAFYAYNLSEAAPQSRMELYDRVVTALIDLRDRDRLVPDSTGLTFREKLLLLQALARHLTVASATTIRLEPLSNLKDSDILQDRYDEQESVATITALEVIQDEM